MNKLKNILIGIMIGLQLSVMFYWVTLVGKHLEANTVDWPTVLFAILFYALAFICGYLLSKDIG